MLARKDLLKKGLIVLVSGAIAGGGVFYMMNKSKQDQEKAFNILVQEKDRIIDLYTTDVVSGYVLLREIAAGEKISEKDIELKFLPKINSPSDLLENPKAIIGRVSKLPLKPNTAITSGMVYLPEELTDDLRKVDYNYVRLPITLKKTDIIEIEIVFPNGASYSVVPKAKLTALDLTNNILFMNAGQEIRFLMDAAWVDMVVNKAEVRALQFVDGETQRASMVEYYPNAAIMELIKRNPEIVQTAKTRYTGEGARIMLEDELRKLFPEGEYKRFGANVPEGSYVSQRSAGAGANIIVVNPDANNSTGEVSTEVGEVIPEEDDSTVNQGTIDYVEDVPVDDVVDDVPATNVPVEDDPNTPQIGDE